MNKLETFTTKLIDLTKNDSLSWEISNIAYQFLPSQVPIIKEFSTTKDELTIVVFECKERIYDPDSDSHYEEYSYGILLVKEGIVAKHITANNVKENLIIKLINIITRRVTDIDADINSILEM